MTPNISDSPKVGKSGRTIIGDIDFHGYPVGDRLLEDVYFVVDIEQDADGRLHVGEVRPHEDSADYLENIRWGNFVPKIVENVQSNIDHIHTVAEEQNTDVITLMKHDVQYANPDDDDPYFRSHLQIIMEV